LPLLVCNRVETLSIAWETLSAWLSTPLPTAFRKSCTPISPTDAEEEDDDAKEDFNKRVERKHKVLPLAFIAMAPPPVACFLELVVVLNPKP
jgi:hypothetical protein